MSVELKCLIVWPDPDKLRETIPSSFKKHYANTKKFLLRGQLQQAIIKNIIL